MNAPQTAKEPFYGWRLVAVLFATYFFNACFPFYGATVASPYIVEDLGLSRIQIGWGFTLFSLTSGLAAPITVKAIERFGVRKTMTVGCLILSLGTASIGLFTQNFIHFALFFGLFTGFGFSLATVMPVQTVLVYWFEKRRALAISIVLSSTGFAAIIFTSRLDALIQNNNGDWRLMWYVVSATGILTAIIAAIGVRNKPEDLGQHVDGVAPAFDDSDNNNDGSTEKAIDFTAKTAAKTYAFWACIIAIIASMFAATACLAHSVIHLGEIGHSKAAAAGAMGYTVFFSIIGRLGAGFLCDRYPPRFIWGAALLFMAIALVLLNQEKSGYQIIIYTASIGIGYGIAMVAPPTLISSYFGIKNFTAIYGAIFMAGTVIGSFSPVVTGFVFDSQGSYSNAFNVYAALAVVGALIIVSAARPSKNLASTE